MKNLSLHRIGGITKTIKGLAEEMFYLYISIVMYPVGLIKWDHRKIMSNISKTLSADSQDKKNPVILVHGYFHNNSAYLLLKKRLKKEGWQHIYCVDLKSIYHSIENHAQHLSKKIDSITQKLGVSHVDLIGHSLGGLVARYYIQNLQGYKKVRNCIAMGCPNKGTWLSLFGIGKSAKQMSPQSKFLNKLNSNLDKLKKVNFISVWSPLDFLVFPPSNAVLDTSSKSVKTDFTGHMGFLFSESVFRIINTTLSTTFENSKQKLKKKYLTKAA